MGKIKNIVSVVLIALIAILSFLKSFWFGFSYIALSLGCVLCVFWTVILIIQYRTDFILNFNEEFKMYCIKLINFENVESEDIERRKNYYIKNFKKTLIKDKIFCLSKIILLLTLAITLIVVMIVSVIK